MKITFRQVVGNWDYLQPFIDGKKMEGVRSCKIEQGWDEKTNKPRLSTATIEILLTDGVMIERE